MEDIWEALLRYDREIATPRLQASEERVTENITRTLRNDMNVHFDAFYKQFGSIDSELVSINAGLKRLSADLEVQL